ncbi:MAG TPA: BamA/TamA family outer membrane protein [Candidatus Tidjanibacter gallistercoris]|nr:BamA/TamA family outer membrane protein [Candidatus Tidjanibacter gallistercoris]
MRETTAAGRLLGKLLCATILFLPVSGTVRAADSGMPSPAVRSGAAPSRDSLYRKTGFSFTPIPALSYSSDLGFQLGAILDAYWFGDGSSYPKYMHKFTAEACYFTKGSGIYYLFYDSEYLLHGLRLTASASYLPNTMMAFYGFNGYSAPYLRSKNAGFYAVDRNLFRIMGDLQGRIAGPLGWAAGAAFFHYDTGRIRVERYAGETTLYDLYRRYGLIREDESGGGSHIELRAGLVYDTRDHEPDPSCGLYADLLLYGAPDIIDRRGYGYMKAAVSFRHYVPVIRGRLVFAYRLCWQGTVAGNPPFYVQQNYATLFLKQINSDILGGAISLRGILYNRVVGDGMAWANAELRLRLFDFRLFGQEWYLTANPFFDMGIVTAPYRMEAMRAVAADPTIAEDLRRTIYSGEEERPHMSAGLGIKIVMNRNLVLSVEYGIPFDRRDGTNGLYLNMNYLF